MGETIIQKYLPIIRNDYADCNTSDITLLDDGHDHYVLVLKDSHAFRFPRTEAHGKKDHVENNFLKDFAKNSPIAVQQITGHTDKETGTQYQTYDFIPGVRLSRETAATLSPQELISVGSAMGKFLAQLHAYPLTKAREIQMDELDPIKYGEYFKEFLEMDRNAFFPLLSQDEQKWIEQSTEDFYTLTKDHPFAVTVTHSDMLPEHIIIDQETHKLNGVIDFSLRIADPANDFKFFDRYGETFLKAVYDNYLPIDEYFDRRREFYAGNLPVANLYQSLERNDEVMVKVHLTQLKEYIGLKLGK
jgi:aminoglycoside phosphotransferase (APT) family kinase protein